MTERKRKAMKNILWRGKIHFLILLCILISTLPAPVLAEEQVTEQRVGKYHFVIQKQIYLKEEEYSVYHMKHLPSGASVIFKDDKDIKKNFSITFASSAKDDKGANHVLEHALLSGTQTYPAKNLFYILQGSTAATMLNGFTQDDAVSYVYETKNAKDFDNLLGLYLDMVFQPLITTEKNLFLREGVRREFAEGKTRYNGVAYNEVRSKSNSILDETLLTSLRTFFPDTIPGYDSGGTPEAMKDLTYEDLIEVYNKYYKPSNSFTVLSGNIDLDSSLEKLDQYLSKSTEERPEQNYGEMPVLPAQKVISFQSEKFGKDSPNGIVSTVVGPKVSDTKEYMAANILMETAMDRFANKYPDTYWSSTTGNGISTSSIILEGIPEEQARQRIEEYYDGYKSMKGMSKEQVIAFVQNYQRQKKLYGNSTMELSKIIDGALYVGDPLCFLESDIYNALCEEDGAFFDRIIDQYFIDNPYRVLVICSPNGLEQSGETNEIQATGEELEQIKQETAAFEAWANTPDPQEVLDRIPKLNPEDFVQMPYDYQVERERVSDIPFVYTKSSFQGKRESVVLSFDLSSLNTEEVPLAQLASQVLTKELKERNVSDVRAEVYANPARYNEDEMKPDLALYIDASGQELTDRLHVIQEILSAPDFLTPEGIQPFFEELKTWAKQGPQSYYTYDLWRGEMSDGQRWNQLAAGTSAGGSYWYYTYIMELANKGLSSAAQTLGEVKQKIFCRDGFALFLQGTEESRETIRAEIPAFKKVLSEKTIQKGMVVLPEEKHSVNIIDKSRSVGVFYQIGKLEPYSGQMQVMAKVLETNYLLPMLRGKGGAYGATATVFSDGGFYMSAARTPNLLAVKEILEGAGDYLKSLTLTEGELNQFIIGAISSLDDQFLEWCNNFGYESTVDQYTLEAVQKERREILSTTVEDIRSFASTVDHMVAQERRIIIANPEQIEQSGLKANVTENMDNLFNQDGQSGTITHEPYIFGMENGLFEPDRLLTRAEAAMLLSRIIAEKEDAERESNLFTDVASETWYAEAVAKVYHAGIMRGYGDGTFRPGDKITGEEFGLISSRVGNLPDDFVLPTGPVSRAQAVQIINALLGRTAGETDFAGKAIPKFADVPQNHPVYKDILEASTKHTCERSEGVERWVTVE